MLAARLHVIPTALLLATILTATLPGPAAALFDSLLAPKAKLWKRWTAHDPKSTRTIDHRNWERLLQRYVARGADGLNRVAYARITPADRKTLDAYIARLAATPISRFSRNEQRAYWINLYNALTLQVVLKRYPVRSIRDIDISPGLLADGPWDRKLLTIEGTRVSLNDIEHRILRPIWRDPRIHYAVNCASVGCPNLRRIAFTAGNTAQMLEASARDYINSPRGVAFKGSDMVVSSIFVWFKSDFGRNDAAVLAHLRHYAAPPLKARLAKITSLSKHRYDWRLNSRP